MQLPQSFHKANHQIGHNAKRNERASHKPNTIHIYIQHMSYANNHQSFQKLPYIQGINVLFPVIHHQLSPNESHALCLLPHMIYLGAFLCQFHTFNRKLYCIQDNLQIYLSTVINVLKQGPCNLVMDMVSKCHHSKLSLCLIAYQHTSLLVPQIHS